MADPIASVWTDPPPGGNGQPRIDLIRHEFYHTPPNGSATFAFAIDVLPGTERVSFAFAAFSPGLWRDDAWTMKDGKYATVKDSVQWTVDGDATPDHTPSDATIPEITDLALEYAA